MNELYKLLDLLIKREISIGYNGFTIFANSQLENEQFGYRVDIEEQSLVGSNNGDWKETWFVIGQDDIVGDAIFVDFSKKSLPVYTAAHGEGDWTPQIISSSLKGFIKTTNYLHNLSQERKTPIAYSQNSLSIGDKIKLFIFIVTKTKRVNIPFWLGYFTD